MCVQDIAIPALRRVQGVLSVQRVVCGCNKEFKVISSSLHSEACCRNDPEPPQKLHDRDNGHGPGLGLGSFRTSPSKCGKDNSN